MSLHLVLYAEGPAEDRGEMTWLPAPGSPMEAEHLGPAHCLVARLVAASSPIPEPAVKFLAPLRVQGRRHQGSDLLSRKRLRQLLTFATAERRPHLVIVMVDEDGQGSRLDELRRLTDGLAQPHVIAVAVREFEAWLIADAQALAAVFPGVLTPTDPESMPPTQAKTLLRSWLEEQSSAATQADRAEEVRQARIELARRSDFDRLLQLRAFQRFRDDLRRALTDHGAS